jgi:hypothetical protein
LLDIHICEENQHIVELMYIPAIFEVGIGAGRQSKSVNLKSHGRMATVQRTYLVGEVVFRPILPLLHMLNDVVTVPLIEAVAGGDGSSLADCDVSVLVLPEGFVLLDRPSLETLCELVLEMAENSPLLLLLPATIYGISRKDLVGALIIYTMEEPCPLYRLLNHPLNVNGVRSKASLRCQLRYLKLLTIAMQAIPRESEYWYTGVVYRGMSIEGNPALQWKYENFEEAFKIGTQLVFAAPTSTTKDSSIAAKFTKGIQFVFQGDTPDCGPGGLMLKEGDLSFYAEQEILLEAPCTFWVVAATKVQETVVVVLQVPETRSQSDIK